MSAWRVAACASERRELAGALWLKMFAMRCCETRYYRRRCDTAMFVAMPMWDCRHPRLKRGR